MKGKVVIITGANTGMGLATVVEPCKARREGDHGLPQRQAWGRGVAAAKQRSGSENIELMLLDLASLDSIPHFCEGIFG
jgi:retinol dehydrogenase-14